MTLTAAFLVAVVRAVVGAVAHFHHGDAVAVVAPVLTGRAGGRGGPAHVVQLVRLVPAVVVPVADEVLRHAAAVLTGVLVLLTGLVAAALLVTAVTTVIPPVTPDTPHRTHTPTHSKIWPSKEDSDPHLFIFAVHQWLTKLEFFVLLIIQF